MELRSHTPPRQSPVTRGVIQAAMLVFVAVTLALSANALRKDGLPLTADWSPQARLKAASGETLVLPLKEAANFFDTGEALFVDARSPELFRQGHIQGAMNMPWQDIDAYLSRFFDHVPDMNSIIVTYCDGESCTLSEDLALMLHDMGYPNVKVLINGWSQWQHAGFPTEKGGDDVLQ